MNVQSAELRIPRTWDQQIGFINNVTANLVEVSMDGASRAAEPEVGAYVVVESGVFAILGQVTDLKLAAVAGTDRREPVAVTQLMTTVQLDTGDISPGVLSRPRLGDRVYLAPGELVRKIAEAKTSFFGAKDKVTLNLARLNDADRSPLALSPEMIFGRHCAIVGTTGGGKSWTVARLVEECSKHKAKVILFDATGEYGTLEGPILHVYLGNHPNPGAQSREVVVPYSQLTEGDLFAIFKPSGQSQAPKLRAAIKTLKLAKLVPSLALDGLIVKANKAKDTFEAEYARHIAALDDPYANFDIRKLPRQIENECVFPTRSAFEQQYWGDINGLEHSQCMPMIARIQDILQSTNLAPIFDPGEKPSLLEVIDKFIDHSTFRVLCVSLQYLSFAHHAREIVANATGRYLLQHARRERFQKNPLLVIVDEAHQFLNTNLEEEHGPFPLDAFGLIAKEGRKYALSICIATQRPRDIPESVLSQMGTLVVHRLINDKDRGVVERASASLDSNTLNSLPVLAPGQAVMLGVDFPVPLAVRVERPTYPPTSRGPNYQEFWG